MNERSFLGSSYSQNGRQSKEKTDEACRLSDGVARYNKKTRIGGMRVFLTESGKTKFRIVQALPVSARLRNALLFSWIRLMSVFIFLVLGFAFLARMRLVCFELEAMGDSPLEQFEGTLLRCIERVKGIPNHLIRPQHSIFKRSFEVASLGLNRQKKAGP